MRISYSVFIPAGVSAETLRRARPPGCLSELKQPADGTLQCNNTGDRSGWLSSNSGMSYFAIPKSVACSSFRHASCKQEMKATKARGIDRFS